jgi:two-component system, sensor histidine kinase YesM
MLKILSPTFKIRNKIFTAFIAIVIVPLIVATLWSYIRVERTLYDNVSISLRNNLLQTTDKMSEIMKNITVARYVLVMNQGGIALLDQYVQYYSKNQEFDSITLVQIKNIDFLLNNVLNSYLPDGSRITLYDMAGSAILIPRFRLDVVNLDKLQKDEYYNHLLSIEVGSPSLWSVSLGDFASDVNQSYINYMQLWQQPEDRKNFFIAVSIPENYIDEHILGNGLAEGSSMFLVNSSGDILASAGAPVSADEIKNYIISDATAKDPGTFSPGTSGVMMMLSDALPYSGWRLLMVVPQSKIISQFNQVRSQYLLILFICFLAFGTSTYWLLHRITKPIEKLAGYISEAEKGRFDVSFNVRSRDEIGVLAKSFQDMLGRIQVLMTQKVYEEKQRNEYKYQALQAQINPHFLLNTLNSIKWLAVLEKKDNIAELIASLGRLMEMSLFRGQEDIPFHEELKNVESYIELQKNRYDHMFSITYDVDEEINQCSCPRLLLQPIVENAIIHGLAAADGACELKITGKNMDGGKTVCISVYDSGVGIPANKVTELLDIGRNKETVFKGIGISNVNERIKLRYGPEFGLLIDSHPGNGTTVTIHIPFIAWKDLKDDKSHDR